MRKLLSSLLALACGFAMSSLAAETRRFDFGAGPPAAGWQRIVASDVYTPAKGFGFLESAGIRDEKGSGPDALRGDCCSSDGPFVFAVDLPEGNYNVSLLLGSAAKAAETTVKAESRELMLENVKTAVGEFAARTFTVNVRTPDFPGGRIGINARESGPPMVAHWDNRLTFEFSGLHPGVAALQIAPAPGAITLFIAGDSTVTQQPDEPWAGWGQMLPRFFQEGVAVANHAESGLALFSFKAQRRLDKILSAMKPGDYVFIQFGHNDQKDRTPGAGPFTTYRTNLEFFVDAARKKGGLPVLVTPVERRRWTPDGKAFQTLLDYAEAVKQVGREKNVPVIDLNAMSFAFYKALGPENSTKAFVHYPAGTFSGQAKALKDDTHHNVYGAYELAKCVVEGIRARVPALAKFLTPDAPRFDPAKPDAFDSVRIPQSQGVTAEKPAGS